MSYAYDSAGRKTSLTLPNGVLVEYAYDAASRVTSITYKQNGTTVLGDLTYEYDKNGNRTEIGGSFARTGIPQAISNTVYNAANHQTTFGNKALTYDNNGHLLSITDPNGTTTYSWNAKNQLVGISGPGVSASFLYDGLGRREKRTINGTLTEFLYDGVNPVQETSGAAVLANILTGLGIDEFFTRTDVVAGVTSNVLTDALGSTIALADASGTFQTGYSYEPFGKTTSSGASSMNFYQYTGRENDGAGLYYYRGRYYDPQLQRFISEDPTEFHGGDINLYAYVSNSPLSFADPYGLEAPLPAPTFPGSGGRTCVALAFAGARCKEPPPNKKSDPTPPVPPAPPPPVPPDDDCSYCNPPWRDPPPPQCSSAGRSCPFGKQEGPDRPPDTVWEMIRKGMQRWLDR